MLFVSCTKDDLTPDTTGKEVTLVVPVSVVGEQSIADASFTRTTSDPGVDDKLTLPQNLYIWVCLQTDSRVGYEKVSVSYRHYNINGASYSWIDNCLVIDRPIDPNCRYHRPTAPEPDLPIKSRPK